MRDLGELNLAVAPTDEVIKMQTTQHRKASISALAGPGADGRGGRSEIAEMVNGLNTAFSEFVAKNNDRVDDIRADLDDLIKKHARNGMGGGGTPTPSAELEIAQKAFFARAMRVPLEAATVDRGALVEYEAAFPEFVRFGDSMAIEVRNAMQIGSDPDGGYWVGPTTTLQIQKRLFETTPMRQLASSMTINGDSYKFPLDANDATTGGWVGETDTREETTTPAVGEQEIFLREQFALPKTTQRLLDMGGLPIEQWLVDKIAEKFSRNENSAFVSGTGVSKPRGFLDYADTATTAEDDARAWGVLQYFPTGAAGAFPEFTGGAGDPDALIDLSLSLKPEYLANAVWLMRRTTARVVRKLKDADGRYLWLDSLTEGGRPLLMGHPVILAEDMPAVASDSYSIAFGDIRAAYLILDHATGYRLVRDNVTQKGKVLFYTYRYTGGDLVNSDAVKLLKFAAS